MATHTSILAWRILWTQEPGKLPSMGLQRVGQSGTTEHNTFSLHIDTYGITLAITLTVFDSFKDIIYLFIFGCTGSSLLRLSLAVGRLGWWLLLTSMDSSHTGFSSCGSQALELGLRSCGSGLVALRLVESSWTRVQTRVPCIGRWILIHYTTGKSCVAFLMHTLNSSVFSILVSYVSAFKFWIQKILTINSSVCNNDVKL